MYTYPIGVMIDEEFIDSSNMSLVTRQPVFGICDKVRLEPTC